MLLYDPSTHRSGLADREKVSTQHAYGRPAVASIGLNAGSMHAASRATHATTCHAAAWIAC